MEKILKSLPIYLQLANLFYEKLANGEWKCGQKLPAVREMAAEYGVNPNTLQRAFGQLERDGYLYTVSTNGRFVTQKEEKLKTLRRRMGQRKIADCIGALEALGYSRQEIGEMMQEELADRA